MSQPVVQISVEELAQHLTEARTDIQFVDVREPNELELASLPAFQNFPLSQYGEWSVEIHSHLDANQETLVLCHHGMRSAQMCQWLVSQGFTRVKNIAGGIDAYSLLVDPAIPRY
jgi:rhodanese-related sulfurtransferase